MTTESPKLYALLIGINFYYPNLLSNGARYGNLNGAVNDIDRVEQFLNRQRKSPDKIYKLTATAAETRSTLDRPTANETEANLPTYANIIKSFDDLTEEAQAGDLVYIHYSGHGGRATSIYPQDIKSNGIDEALVPTDIGFDDGRYIRDLELAVLLKRMVDKGLIVTLILDSCHSGGSTRGNNVKIRGLSKDAIDCTDRPTNSLVNPTEAEIAAVASGWTNPKYATRGGTPVATIIPEVNGYVLLAACRPSEFAHECAFDESRESNGSLTYSLLDTLNQPFPGITYKMIHDRLSSKIKIQFPTQNPMILGEGDRVFLGQDFNVTPFAVNVKDVRLDENKVLLDAGQAQGMRKGSEFVIYPARSLSFDDQSQRIAIAKITERDATESWAEITTVIRPEAVIETGSQAVLTAVPVKLLKKVRLLRDKTTPEERKPALEAVARAIANNGWVRLVAEAEDKTETADYQVDVKVLNSESAEIYHLNEGEVIYEICDRAGEPIILRPAIRISDAEAAAKIVKRLVHLAKYQAVEELDNHDISSKLKGKIEIEVLGKMDDYERGDRIEPEPFDDPENPTINVDEYLFFKIHNRSSLVLNFTVLDLQSNWAISQVEPAKPTSQYTPIEAGQEELIVLKMSLPEREKKGTDIFKVFATRDTANFRWLTLDSLDMPFRSQEARGINTRSTKLNALAQMLANFGEDNPTLKGDRTRTGNPVAFPSNDWTTEQITFQVNNH